MAGLRLGDSDDGNYGGNDNGRRNGGRDTAPSGRKGDDAR